MENSVDALKIAFGVLVFIIALTATFMLLSQAKQTSDIIFFSSDKTNYYNYKDYSDSAKTVGIDTVIATLYRYYNDSIRVTIKCSDGTVLEVFDTSLETGAPWLSDAKSCQKSIDYFISGIPFGGAEINGQQIDIGGIRGTKSDSSGKFFISKDPLLTYKDKKFTETFDEVKYSGRYIIDGDEKLKTLSGGTKIYITYTIKNT